MGKLRRPLSFSKPGTSWGVDAIPWFSGWFEAFYIIFNSRRHSYMEAGYNHVPCRFSSVSSDDIQGIGGWAKLNKSTTVSTFEILASKGRTTEMLFLWRTL